MTTRVLVADDQELVRTGLRMILEAQPGIQVVGEASDGKRAVQLAQELRPDVCLFDIRMPGMDGIEATRRLAGRGVTAPLAIIVITTFDLDEYVYAAVRAGASGFLLKDVSPADLVHAVEAVARGEVMLAPVLTRRLLERFAATPDPSVLPEAVERLTEREAEVLRLVARGLSNADIAQRLFLSEATVKTYVSRLLSKLAVRDRVQLAVLAYETGLVRVGENLDKSH